MMLNKFHMQGGIILNSIHIEGKSMIEEVIYGLYIRNNLLGVIWGLNNLKFAYFV